MNNNLSKWLEYKDIENYGIDLDHGIISPDDIGFELDELDPKIMDELEREEEGIL